MIQLSINLWNQDWNFKELGIGVLTKKVNGLRKNGMILKSRK